jgi:hypothetical protein
MAKPAAPSSEYLNKLDQYDRLIATVPGLERKGAANPYTAFNGNMSSYLHPRGELALRLPPGLREKFVRDHNSRLFEAYGIIQKEYVTVPHALLADTSSLARYFKASCDYVAGLKPKPSKRGR